LINEQGNEIELDGELVDQGVYHYFVQHQNILAHTVNLKVIKQQSQLLSESMGTHEDFYIRLLEHDGCCVWTGLKKGVGMHIILHRQGNEACSDYSWPGMQAKFSILLQWLWHIIDNQPHSKNLNSLVINDIQNGIYAINNLYNQYFDPRHVIILKVCPSFSLE